MEVEALIDPSLVFAGDEVHISIDFIPPPPDLGPPPVLLSGYAVVQGSFRLGDMILSAPFAETRKAGVVLGRRGFEYGAPANSGGLFSGMLDGLRSLVVSSPNPGIGDGPGGSSLQSSNEDDDGDYPIFSTSQILLFTDLPLVKREKFRLAVDLPANLPPTYRSRSLHITYNLVVGFERVIPGSKPLDTRLFLPFRLLPRPPTEASFVPEQFDLRRPINAPPPVLNAVRDFGEDGADDDDVESADAVDGGMERFMHELLNEGSTRAKARRSSSISGIPGAHYTKVHYEVSRNRLPIATLVFARPAVSVGDVLSAQLRFHRPCLHLSAYLELEEAIEDPYAAIPGTQSGGSSATGMGRSSTSSARGEGETAMAYTVYAKQFLGTYGLQEVSVYLPTLTSITPRLDTEQVHASWSLRLEFVGLIGSAFAETEEEGDGMLAKGQVDYELFTCRLPVIILPPVSGVQHGAAKSWRF